MRTSRKNYRIKIKRDHKEKPRGDQLFKEYADKEELAKVTKE